MEMKSKDLAYGIEFLSKTLRDSEQATTIYREKELTGKSMN